MASGRHLEELRNYYKLRGYARKLRDVTAELEDLRKVRRFAYQHWEERLELSAEKVVPAADKLLLEAARAAKGFNPFTRGDRLRRAAQKYQKVLINYPNSTAVDDAAFELGEISARHSRARSSTYLSRRRNRPP